MSVHSSANILTLSNIQAKELAGREVTIGAATYIFNSYDPDHPGHPPWRSGAEGKAYPLLGCDGSVAAYLKFFTHPTQMRFDRTAWLIGQQIHTWLPSLAAAPLLWADTRHACHSTGTGFDFAGYLARAVPGTTWLEIKSEVHYISELLSQESRWRCVQDLVLALAVLEVAGIVHGDLSPNNIIIDTNAPADAPALYLIDFDGFVAPAAGASRALAVAEGGTYGTDGYCPPDIAARANGHDTSVAPYSDRYGRDMLLLELLFMDRGLSPDDPPAKWNHGPMQRRYAAWRARTDPACWQPLLHLEPATVFTLSEHERPASTELAKGLGFLLPAELVLWPVTEPLRVTPAIPGRKPAAPAKATPFRQHPAYSQTAMHFRRRSSAGVPTRPEQETKAGWRDRWRNSEDEIAFVIVILIIPVVLACMWMLAGCPTP